jgi:hypothetical protein
VQRHEIRSLADLAGEGTRVLTALVRDMHSGIAGRVFDAVGPVSKPVQLIHDATAAITYHVVDGAVRGSLRGAGALAAEAWSNDNDDTVQAHPRPPARSRRSMESTGMSWPTGGMDSR